MPKSPSMALTGKTIVITRAASQSAELRNRLEDLGARVIECPTIQIVPPKSWKPVDDAIRRLETYNGCYSPAPTPSNNSWIAWEAAGRRFRLPSSDRRQREKLAEWGLKPSLVPADFRAEGLLEAFPENLVGTRMLFPRAEVARELLPDELRRRGATVDIVTVYRTVKALPETSERFWRPSASTASFSQAHPRFPRTCTCLPTGTALAVIGPVTREAAQLLGLKPDIVPVESTIPALVAAIREYFQFEVTHRTGAMTIRLRKMRAANRQALQLERRRKGPAQARYASFLACCSAASK